MEQYFIDASLCNFADKKRGEADLVYEKDMEYLHKIGKNLTCNWIKTYGAKKAPKISSFDINNQIIPFVSNILKIGAGKMTLAGGSIRSLLCGDFPTGYDIFFYDIEPSNAEILINQCIIYLCKCSKYKQFTRSEYSITIHIQSYDIQFVRRIYTTKSQILLSFDLAGARLGWDHDGIFATIDGAIACAFNGFVLDLTQTSTSFSSRLQKYEIDKLYNIYLPNMIEMRNTVIGDIEMNTSNNSFMIYCTEAPLPNCVYDDINWQMIADGRYNDVKFGSKEYNNLLQIDEKTIRESLEGHIWNTIFEDNVVIINIKNYKKFLGDQFKSFTAELLINEDMSAANKIWQSRREYFIDIGKEIANNMRLWSIIDSKKAPYKQINPITINPREWFGDNYVPFIVGLNDDRVKIFRLCCGRICADLSVELPDDIDKLLINYWFEAEVADAKSRILTTQSPILLSDDETYSFCEDFEEYWARF